MLIRQFIVGLIVTLSAQGALEAQAQFIPLPPEIYDVNDITPDGKIIVGRALDASTGNNSGFYWRWQTDPTPTLIGGKTAVAVSDDGQFIAGNVVDPSTDNMEAAGRWTPTTGWTSLGSPAGTTCGSSAWDMSGDGSIIVGLTCGAFVWDQTNGMVLLQVLGPPQRPSVISRDGSVIGGFCQGSFNRSPAIWDPVTTAGTAFDLNAQGEVRGVSDDGSVVLGSWYLGGADGYFDAFVMDDGMTPINLGSLNSGWGGAAVAVSNDRTRICGFDYVGLGSEAWVWDQGVGIVSLQQKLIQAGVPGVPFLGRCDAMTPDGSIIVGETNFQGTWIAVLPTASAEVYGCGLNPAGSMQVSGVPTLGGVVTLGLDNPLGTQAPGSGTLLMVSFAPQPNYPCGLPTFDGSMTPGQPGELLVNLPAFFLPGLPWAGTGTPANFPIPIPTSPSTLVGLSIYCQGAILDNSPGGINGLTEAARLRIGIY